MGQDKWGIDEWQGQVLNEQEGHAVQVLIKDWYSVKYTTAHPYHPSIPPIHTAHLARRLATVMS